MYGFQAGVTSSNHLIQYTGSESTDYVLQWHFPLTTMGNFLKNELKACVLGHNRSKQIGKFNTLLSFYKADH